jgi:hypothetical protein
LSICDILQNNGYDRELIKNPPQKRQKQNTHAELHHQKKWVTFTYSGKEVRGIVKLLRNTKVKVAFRTQNTIQNILKPKSQIEKYSRSGIYQMKCMDCPMKYIGQTGRTFNTRYKEHIHDIRSNNSNSGYSNHILNTGHAYGAMTDTMDIIAMGRKGKHLNTLERYHMYKTSRENLHKNDTHIDTHNLIFEALQETDTK